MSIIHGSWILQPHNERFFVWGETWRSLVNLEIATEENGSIHPFCLDKTELISLLEDHKLSKQIGLDYDECSIIIPSQKLAKRKNLVPIFSQNLPEIIDNSVIQMCSWQVSGLSLNSKQAIAFFKALPLNNLSINYLGSDLVFWHHVYRWSLDLINRNKFLPGVEVIDDKSCSVWQPLLDADIDLTRLAKFSQLMPEVCLSYQQDINVSSQELLLQFLAIILDANLRNSIEPNINFNRTISISSWLRSLNNSKDNNTVFDTDENNLKKIQNALYNWTLPIGEYLVSQENTNLGQNSYRVAFILEPPATNAEEAQGDWSLKYYLQALDDSEFIVDSETIWQNTESILNYHNRQIEQAQETLLKGLGLAARIYAPIAESLEQSNPISCELNPIQVYEFLRSIAWQLQNNGLGVIMPPGLDSGGNEQRLGVGIDAQVTQKKGERLSLKSLLKYNLSITVGDTTLSKADFEKILDRRSPVVEINGKWLLLQPADVRAAQSVLNKSNEALNLSVEDALRLSTGDTKTLVKLPVVKFEAQGVLQELISNLTENKAVEPITNIEDFKGTLRPYQARGVGWLAFLEKWSLGACLADDMGLGKCVLPDTNIAVNGIIETAENIWQKYYQEILFDGEGYWSKPKEAIYVNSLDERSGKTVKGKIVNLYRQQISEKIKVITLQDNKKIAITKQHKLLTKNGWKNIFEINDSICIYSETSLNNISTPTTNLHTVFNKAIKPDYNISHNYQTYPSINSTLVENNKPIRVYPCSSADNDRFPHNNYLQILKKNRSDISDKLNYCPIKSIEEIDYEGWVYDFEIAEHHNFVANNIICHNTIQTIGFLLNLKQEDSLVNPTLLVCPTSVLNNWEREVRKFAPTLSTVIHHGDRRKRGKSFIEAIKNKNLVITSYSLVHRDSRTLNRVNWQGVVLDEAQNIKNSTSKQSQAVRQIPAGFKIALTGTPVENRLTELWSILDFLNPDFLGNKTFFQKRFANPIEKYGDRDSLNILRSLVQPFILRRLKTDKNIIQDLPEKQEMNVFCGLSEEQAEFYQKLVDDSLVKIEESDGIQRHGLVLTLLLRLKQLCNHPELISSKTKTTKPDKIVKDVNNFCNRSGKLMRLTEMLEEIIAEKSHALIFTQFSEWGKLLQFYLENSLNQEVLFLYGATRRKQRQEMIDRFQNDPNAPQIFILSLKAGGTGLNLTRANHVFHVDRWWNPAVENQATDRAFRIGQKRNVQVHKFVCSGTLEERINDIIESKQELAEQTVDAGEQWLTRLDTDKLRSLLLLDRDRILDEDA